MKAMVVAKWMNTTKEATKKCKLEINDGEKMLKERNNGKIEKWK